MIPAPRGENLYLTLCLAADPAASVRRLEPWAWQDLYHYLCATATPASLRGELLSLVLLDGAGRYAACATAAKPLTRRKTDA